MESHEKKKKMEAKKKKKIMLKNLVSDQSCGVINPLTGFAKETNALASTIQEVKSASIINDDIKSKNINETNIIENDPIAQAFLLNNTNTTTTTIPIHYPTQNIQAPPNISNSSYISSDQLINDFKATDITSTTNKNISSSTTVTTNGIIQQQAPSSQIPQTSYHQPIISQQQPTSNQIMFNMQQQHQQQQKYKFSKITTTTTTILSTTKFNFTT